MLVISAKPDETVNIGDGIVVKVLACYSGRVKIGIQAPAETKILRGKLMAEIARRIDAGEPLHAIEDDLDRRDNVRPGPLGRYMAIGSKWISTAESGAAE